MATFNKLIVVGNLGRDPELRYTPQGDAVCSFSIATTEKRKDQSGEMQDVTTWMKATLWRRQAELASEYLKKGDPVYLEGRIRLDEYTDREGNKRSQILLNVSEMQFLGTKNGGGVASGAPSIEAKKAAIGKALGGRADLVVEEEGPDDSDIPF